MQLFCLQLEASCLQLSFFAYSCVWQFFAYNLSFFMYSWCFCLQSSFFAYSGKVCLPRTGRRTPRAGTPTSLRAGDPPSRPEPLPPGEGARGKGSWLLAREGVLGRGFQTLWAVSGNNTSPNEPGPHASPEMRRGVYA